LGRLPLDTPPNGRERFRASGTPEEDVVRQSISRLFVSVLLALALSCGGGGGSGGFAGLSFIVVVDAVGQLLGIFDIGDDGTPTPLSTIFGLDNPIGVAFDIERNQIYIAELNLDSIKVFDSSQTGAAVPVRELVGVATQIDAPSRVSLDLTNSEMYVGNVNTDAILVFDLLAAGNTAPKRSIAGVNTGFAAIDAVAVDTVANEIFAVGIDADEIFVFNRTDSGNIPPKRSIVGALTLLDEPLDIEVDMDNGELIVANTMGQNILIFPIAAMDNTAPTRVISNAANLGDPVGVDFNPQTGEIFVADSDGDVLVFDRLDDGDTVPKRMFDSAALGTIDDLALAD
jgi:DNA-binding beta-propeller fold protein YncE